MIDFSNENVIVVSDTHFRHKRLCENEENPFERARHYKYITEMDEDIIEKWNLFVKNDDIVIFMGDFLLGCPAKEIVETFYSYYNKLNRGKQMYWIVGNHDHIIRKKIGFEKLNMCWNMMFTKENKLYVLQHHGFDEVSNKMPQCDYSNVVFVHGHTHNTEKISTFQYKGMDLVQNNVCWDAWYRPVNVNELKNSINTI